MSQSQRPGEAEHSRTGSFPAGEVVKPAHSPHLGQITGKSCQPTYLQVLTATQGPPNLLLHLSFTGRQGTEGLNPLQVIFSRSLCYSTARTCRYVSQERMSPTGLPPPLPSPAGWVVDGSAPLLRVSHGRAGAGWAMRARAANTDHFSKTNWFSTEQSIIQTKQIKAAAAGLMKYIVTYFQIRYRCQARI